MIIAILILVIPAGVLVWEAQSDQVLVKVSSSGEFLLFPLETLCHLWQPVEPYLVHRWVKNKFVEFESLSVMVKGAIPSSFISSQNNVF
jgi:hypothetical protein